MKLDGVNKMWVFERRKIENFVDKEGIMAVSLYSLVGRALA